MLLRAPGTETSRESDYLEPIRALCASAATLLQAVIFLDQCSIQIGLVGTTNRLAPPVLAHCSETYPGVRWWAVDDSGRLYYPGAIQG